MDQVLREHVRQRAASCCEYCQMPQEFIDAAHEVDHVIAEKHHGPTTLENLALACFHCNNHKGPNIAGLDPATGQLAWLFHPRDDLWAEHFRWDGPVLLGTTPIGRVTVDVLAINLLHRVLHRMGLIEEGVYPPGVKKT